RAYSLLPYTTLFRSVEIPFTWGLDDFPAFEYVTIRGSIQQGLSSPSAVYEIWKGDFDYLYDRMGEGVYTLTMHPQVIGRGHRLLDRKSTRLNSSHVA